MPTYLRAQAEARDGKKGLWASDVMVERAAGLMREWSQRSP